MGREGNGDAQYAVGAVRCRTGFPAWPSSPDLLVNDGEFCGVVYSVPAEYRIEVRLLASFLDARAVQYIGGPISERPAAYTDELQEDEFLQIKWSVDEPSSIALAQLGGDFWYYAGDEQDGTDMQRFWALGLGDLPDILDQHELRFPHRLAIPQTLIVKEHR
jgi:hypothetical protein